MKQYYSRSRIATKEGHKKQLFNPYTQKPYAELNLLTEADLKEVLNLSKSSTEKDFPKHARIKVLEKAALLLEKRSSDFAKVILEESGKPIRFANVEAERATENFRIAAAFLRQDHDRVINMDSSPQGENKLAIWKPFSRGIVLGITPYNFPLNLVVHKVCPAIASNSPIIIKPDLRTPYSALMLNDLLIEAGLPDDFYQTVLCDNLDSQFLASSSDIKTLSFTGSQDVGWKLKSLCPEKKVLLELGGTATVIYDEPKDLKIDTMNIANSAMAYSGQVCISCQNVLVNKKISNEFIEQLKLSLTSIAMDDPAKESTIIGPLIDSNHKQKLEQIIKAADSSVKSFVFGNSKENFLAPHLLIHENGKSALLRKELFGPIINVLPYGNFEEAIEYMCSFESNLQASIYTNSLERLFEAERRIDAGALIHNAPPSFRLDHMPYGGNGRCGFGREGIEYAFEEYCDRRLLVIDSQRLSSKISN